MDWMRKRTHVTNKCQVWLTLGTEGRDIWLSLTYPSLQNFL